MKNLLLLTSILFTIQLRAQNVVEISLNLVELTVTEKVYDLVVEDFDSILALQYSMSYDSTKMRLKEIRNFTLPQYNGSSFNDPQPGSIISVWLDLDLEPADFANPITMCQLAFDVLEPGGSTLCFSDTPVSYEFVVYDAYGDSKLTDLIIHDDCYTELFIPLSTTGVQDPESSLVQPLTHVYLSQNGELAFTTSNHQIFVLVLYDILGRVVTSTAAEVYTAGRHTVAIGRKIPNGIYILQSINEHGRGAISSVFAQ